MEQTHDTIQPTKSKFQRVHNLLSLDDVGTTRSWNYSQPTLQIPGRFTRRTPMSTSSFLKTFYASYPGLKGMNWSNIVIHGGAIVDILLGKQPSDLDFCFYGFDTENELLVKAREVIDYLHVTEHHHIAEENERSKVRVKEAGYGKPVVKTIDMKAVRRGSVITLAMSSIKTPLQFVLGMNESIEQLANTADIAVTGVVFDGKNVWFTQNGKSDLENMSITLRSGRYPTTNRLSKYFNKGFDIILPELDVAKLPKRYLEIGLLEAIQTPSFGFAYSAVKGNKIDLNKFITVDRDLDDLKSELKKLEERLAGSGGRYNEATSNLEIDSRSILYGNIRTLSRVCQQRTEASTAIDVEASPSADPEEGNQGDKVKGEEWNFAVFAEGDSVANVLNPWPDITDRQVKNIYAGICASIYDKNAKKLDFHTYDCYVTVEPITSVLTRVAGLAASEGKSVVSVTCAEVIEDVVERQMAASKAMCEVLKGEFENTHAPVLKQADPFFLKCDILAAKAFYGDYLL